MSLPSVMIVEDEQITALDLEATLRHLGYPVVGIAASGAEALDLAAAQRPGLVLMDIRLQGPLDGIATAERLQALRPVPIVYLSAHADQSTVERAALSNAEGYLVRPFAEHELQTALTLAMVRHALEQHAREANMRLQATVAALERRNAELQVLQTLASDLQLAETSAEACVAIAAAVRQFFPQDAGVLLLRRAGDGLLEAVFAWGNGLQVGPPIPAADCPALHDRQIRVSGDAAPCALCRHATDTHNGGTSCVPLATADQAIGVLLLGHEPPAAASVAQPPTEALADRRRLATALASQAALGLANVLLRDMLREQAIRDPLTGLFNRRYLDETLLRELAQAERGRYPIGLILLDIDHFKQVNDTYGHPAGDALLRAMGALLRSQVRSGDIACRYGGEEFLLVLPTASGEAAVDRAEMIRKAVAQLQLEHEGRQLPTVTLSAGVTSLHDLHDGIEAALLRADQALYAAKAAGRDQVALSACDAPRAG